MFIVELITNLNEFKNNQLNLILVSLHLYERDYF